MTVACPRGHESATTDYCDQCGALLEQVGAHTSEPDEPSNPLVVAANSDETDSDAADTDQVLDRPPSQVERCPRCDTPRTGDDRFCEVDGFDFESTSDATTVHWEAVVSADRAYYDALATDDIAFPSDFTTRTFILDGDELLIGRRSESRGIDPDIDLAGAPQDDGISHRHAVLVRCHDGTYALVDRGSTNGTAVDAKLERIPTDTPIPLRDGSRIHVGAWTTITIHMVAD